MDIKLLDHVVTCSTYSDGEVIYDLIAQEIVGGNDVTLSFQGVSAVPSAFINASIVRLVESTSLDNVRRHLKISDSTRQINELILSRFEFLSKTSAAGS